ADWTHLADALLDTWSQPARRSVSPVATHTPRVTVRAAANAGIVVGPIEAVVRARRAVVRTVAVGIVVRGEENDRRQSGHGRGLGRHVADNVGRSDRWRRRYRRPDRFRRSGVPCCHRRRWSAAARSARWAPAAARSPRSGRLPSEHGHRWCAEFCATLDVELPPFRTRDLKHRPRTRESFHRPPARIPYESGCGSARGRAENVFNFCTKVFHSLNAPKWASSKIPPTAVPRRCGSSRCPWGSGSPWPSTPGPTAGRVYRPCPCDCRRNAAMIHARGPRRGPPLDTAQGT